MGGVEASEVAAHGTSGGGCLSGEKNILRVLVRSVRRSRAQSDRRTASAPRGYWRSFDSAPPTFPPPLAQDDREV